MRKIRLLTISCFFIILLSGDGIFASSTSTVRAQTPLADLSLTKTSSRTSVEVGIAFEYTLTVYNAGPSDATNVVVTDLLPPSVSFVASENCIHVQSVVTCTLPSLPAESSQTFALQVRAETAGIIVNTASVSSDTPDSLETNNSAEATVVIVEPPESNLVLRKSVQQNRVQFVVGEVLDYVLTVVNRGPDPATGVVIVDTLPGQLSFISSEACVTDGVTLACEVGELLVDATFTAIVRVRAIGVGQTVVNSAQVAGNEQDPDLSNNSASTTVTITAQTATPVIVTTTPQPPQSPITIIQTVPVVMETQLPTALPESSQDTQPDEPLAPSDIYGWRRFESVDWIQVTGTWALRTAENASDQAYHETRDTGAILRYPFTGDGFRVGFRSSVNGASFVVQVDGETVGVYETDSLNFDQVRATYVSDPYFVPTGYHVVDVIAMADGEGSQNVNIDFIEIFTGPPMPERPSNPNPEMSSVTVVPEIELVAAPPTPIPTAAPQSSVVLTVDVFVYYDTNANDQMEPSEGVRQMTVQVVDVTTNTLLSTSETDATGFVRVQVMTTNDIVLLVPLLGESFYVRSNTRTQEQVWSLRLSPANVPPLVP